MPPLAPRRLQVGQNTYLWWADEKLDSRTGTPWMAGGARNYTRKWLVKVKDNRLGANVILRAMGLFPYMTYATPDGGDWDTQALLVSARLEDPVDVLDGYHKIVVAEYSTEMPPGGPVFSLFGIDPAGAQNNPEMVPPEVEWDGEVIREAPPYDLDKKAYLNSANQPYKPAPSFEKAHAVLIYTRNQLSYNNREHVRYSFAVNSDTFLGEAPGTVQLLPPRAKMGWIGAKSYWRVTYRFRFNSPEGPRPTNTVTSSGTGLPVAPAPREVFDPLKSPLRSWQPQILDCGTMQLQKVWAGGPNFNFAVPIFRGAHAVTEPVLLNGSGVEQRTRDANNQLIPVYNAYRQFLAIPFTPILVTGFVF